MITYHGTTKQLRSTNICASTLDAVIVILAHLNFMMHCSVCFVCSIQFAVDVVLLMAPMMLCLTVLSDVAAVFLISLIVLVITLLTLTHHQNTRSLKISADLLNIEMTGKLPFVTNYRAFVNAASAICILAVDFLVFPRRLCKTETNGTGLMDAGVAGYVFANAIVSPEARGHVSRYHYKTSCSYCMLLTVVRQDNENTSIYSATV